MAKPLNAHIELLRILCAKTRAFEFPALTGDLEADVKIVQDVLPKLKAVANPMWMLLNRPQPLNAPNIMEPTNELATKLNKWLTHTSFSKMGIGDLDSLGRLLPGYKLFDALGVERLFSEHTYFKIPFVFCNFFTTRSKPVIKNPKGAKKIAIWTA